VVYSPLAPIFGGPVPDSATLTQEKQELINSGIELLRAAGSDFHRRGWSLATSSNYSIVVSENPLRLLMTASGKDKGALNENDFVLVDENAKVVSAAKVASEDKAASEGKAANDDKTLRPSAEAALHVMLAKEFAAGSILHTHSVWSTVLSEKYAAKGALEIGGLEMLKALNGIKTHETSVSIPIFANDQDIDALAQVARNHKPPLRHAFLVRGHGLYTWGINFEEAKRQIEAIEFLLEVIGRQGGLA